MTTMFNNRQEAGRLLAEELLEYKDTMAVTYALPRGGVVLGKEISEILNIPFDLIITRKIGHPDNPEYAIASVTERGDVYLNPKEPARVNDTWFDMAMEREQSEARRRREVYMSGKDRISAKGKTAIIVDDGVATGASMLLAIQDIKKDIPWKIVVAVPVLSAEIAEIIKGEADELVALSVENDFLGSISAYYADFSEVTDEDVMEIMKKSGRE
jgi:predicted phosphoribosyltransferase